MRTENTQSLDYNSFEQVKGKNLKRTIQQSL